MRGSALSSSWAAQDAASSRVLKQLILTADDFGRSAQINEAVERACEAGFLTQASLMVNEPAADEAARIARRHPALCVGLHLTLCAGRASGVSVLTDAQGNFVASPARAGLRYAFRPSLAELLREEIGAQFAKFRALGFAPSYWDGHTHLHLHPTILQHTLPIAAAAGFCGVRLVREPGRPALLPKIFELLSAQATPALQRHGLYFTDRIFGLRETGRIRTATIASILRNLPDGLSELYFHPGAEPEEIDYAALVPLFAQHGITPRSLPPPSTAR